MTALEEQDVILLAERLQEVLCDWSSARPDMLTFAAVDRDKCLSLLRGFFRDCHKLTEGARDGEAR